MIKTPLSTVLGGAFWTPGATVINGAKLGFEIVMKKLFTNGEQGFWYDPSDMGTMFQDAAGTVPVTAVGQPVGLMLDKSKGLVLSEELVANVNFNNGWVTVSSTITSANSFSVSSPQGGVRNNVFKIGKSYEISVGYTTSQSDVSLELRNGTSAAGALISKGLGPTATITAHLINAASTSLYLRTTNPTDITVTSISVKELAGSHAYQTTSASRPILRQNTVTGAYYLEFDGADDFLRTSDVSMSLTDKVTVITGMSCVNKQYQGLIHFATSNFANSSFYMAVDVSNRLRWQTTGNVLGSVTDGSSLVPSVYTAKSDIGGKSLSLAVNQTKTSISTDMGTGNFGNYPLTLGARQDRIHLLQGDFYGLIGIGKLTTDTETTAIEKEFAKRVGVTLNV